MNASGSIESNRIESNRIACCCLHSAIDRLQGKVLQQSVDAEVTVNQSGASADESKQLRLQRYQRQRVLYTCSELERAAHCVGQVEYCLRLIGEIIEAPIAGGCAVFDATLSFLFV